MKEIIKHWIKELFSKQDLLYLIEKELREASMALLQAESAMEYAGSMVDYNTARVERLKNRLKALESTQ
jgi:hypothetical protein